MQTEFSDQIDGPPLSLSVILPAYNEGSHIYENIKQVCLTLKGYDYEVIVVDDGSNDNTYQESLRSRQDGFPVQAIQREKNYGKGSALIYGCTFAQNNYIVFLDADLEIDATNIHSLLEKMLGSGAEIIIGNKDQNNITVPPLRRMMSFLYQKMVAVLFEMPLHDTQTGIKIIRKDVLQACIPMLKVSRFAFDVELLVAAHRFGYHILEQSVGVSYKRKASLERIKPKQIAHMFLDTLSIYYRASFWSWLRPGLTTKIWMLCLIIGFLLFGMGLAKLITPLILIPPIKNIFYIVALQFLPLVVRDWLLTIFGFFIVTISAIKLNTILLNSFARRDRGDLAGILIRPNDKQ